MLQLIADVNWLLSALAQASAALVAIVGGLLVSRYVTLHAEQQAARRRAGDLDRRIDEAQAHLAKSKLDLELHSVGDYLDDVAVFETIVRERWSASPDSVLAAKDSGGIELNQDLLTERLTALQEEMERAHAELLESIPRTKGHPTWTDFKREHSFSVDHWGAWDWLYEKIVETRVEEAQKAEREKRKKTGVLVNPIPDLATPVLRPQRLRSTGSNHQEVGLLRERTETAQAEVRALKQERRLAVETFEATRQPEGFSLALQVLSILATLGMGVPVVVMAFGPLTLPWGARAGVVAIFIAAVVLLLRFLFAYAAYLRGARRALPRSALGLLDPRKQPADS